MNHKLIGLLISLLFSGFVLQAQSIHGIIVDSVSQAPLPYTYIKVKNTTDGTVADEHGRFSINTGQADTLTFSYVGYVTLEVPVKGIQGELVVNMVESSTLLKQVTIYDQISLKGLPQLQRQSKWTNPANSPGYGMVQTVGIGYSFKNPMFRFSRSEKEKQKLKVVQDENSKIKTYMDVVNSPEVKDSLMHQYSLSETEYYEILARYNQAFVKTKYSLDTKSLTFSIFQFFGTETHKK